LVVQMMSMCNYIYRTFCKQFIKNFIS